MEGAKRRAKQQEILGQWNRKNGPAMMSSENVSCHSGPTCWVAVLWQDKLIYLAADVTISHPFAALLGSNTHLDSTLTVGK